MVEDGISVRSVALVWPATMTDTTVNTVAHWESVTIALTLIIAAWSLTLRGEIKMRVEIRPICRTHKNILSVYASRIQKSEDGQKELVLEIELCPKCYKQNSEQGARFVIEEMRRDAMRRLDVKGEEDGD